MENNRIFDIKDSVLKRYTGLGGDVSIPEGITSIGSAAFRGCTGLTSITIPEGVAEIGDDAFQGCTGLTDIQVDAGNPVYCSIDGLLLKRDEAGLVLEWCPQGKTGALTIPEGVTNIYSGALADCAGPLSVTLPGSITRIDSALSGCTGLTHVTISEGVAGIGKYGFRGCTGLTSINFPASVTSIDLGAFNGCTRLSDIYVHPENKVYSSFDGALLKREPEGLAMYYCPLAKVGGLRIPRDVTRIDSLNFKDRSSLTYFSVESGNRVYRSMDGLLVRQDEDGLTLVRCPEGKKGKLAIPEGITKIGDSALRGCTYLTCVILPESVAKICPGAFCACVRMESIYIPEGVTDLGDIYWDDNSTEEGKTTQYDRVVGGGAFKRCYQLKDVYLPASVMDMDWGIFSDCGCGDYVTHILTIHAPTGSYAEEFARDHRYRFVPARPRILGTGGSLIAAMKKDALSR